MGKKLSLDDLLETIEQQVDDPALIDNLRDAIDEQAQNPELVKNLRSQISERDRRLNELVKKDRVAVLKAAGVPEKAHDRFLRDWDAEKAGDELTEDSVKAAADEFGYRLETPTGSETPQPGADADEMRARREAQERRQDARVHSTPDDTLPPDLDTRIEEAQKAGDLETVFALKRQKLEKAS